MALRRVLPSRSTPEKSPDGAATASSKPSESKPRNEPVANPVTETPAAAPQTTSSATAPDAFAAAATSAFSTLPSAPPARVLEDSFTKPVAPVSEPEAPASTPEPAFSAPAWENQVASVSEPAIVAPAIPLPAAEPAPAAFAAPAWEAEVQAAAEAAAANAARQAAKDAEPAPVIEPEPAFVAPAWEAPASFASQEPVAAAMVEPAVAEPIQESSSPFLPTVPEVTVPEVAVEPVAVPEMTVAPVTAPQMEAAPQTPEVAPQPEVVAGPTSFEFQPSRPDNNQHKRRVREKRPRDFTAMGAPENQAPERPKPQTSFAAHVPVDTRSLDKVDEELINSGVMAPRPLDSLTGALPTGLAETAFAPLPEPTAAPEPLKLPESQPATAPVAAAPLATPEPAPAPAVVPIIVPAAATPVIAAAPEPLPPLPVAAPEPVAPPVFNLSNTPPAPVAAPLAPPQSDLPWTQTQAAAEWEIETPDNTHWHTDTSHDASASTPAASHMPPPTADLYKPLGNGSSAPQMPMSGIPSRSGTNFTPELPGQRRKAGGTPWAVIAVGALILVGGGAYFMRSGGTGQVQQQLANLTSKAAGNAEPDVADASGILPPPRTENASFYTPPTTTDPSSSALVNFADVPAGEANQPIVATGDEEMPKDMSFFGKMSAEVEKVRAAKAAGLPVGTDPSATTPAATATAAITPDKLQEELAAYRTALAQSANPASLTPSAFKRDPDGYMDGKTGVTDGAGSPTGAMAADMASGALLPPPNGASVMPPPDLYTNNPKNLPVVSEPVANAPARVRTLSDFPDIEPYAPEREKVEIPKNLKPKVAATDFPALEVLSFVPGKGIVAFADGREGVLLIGESMNGWELVNVTPDNAEFKAGQKSYQVTSDN